MDKNNCNICKIRAYIECDQCEDSIYLCSRAHLQSHKIKYHNSNKTTLNISLVNTGNKQQLGENNTHTINRESQIDMRKLFEYIQTLKKEIENKFESNNHLEVVLLINKCLPIAKKFYQDDHIFVNFY